jgi:hypothetical protein
MRFLLIIILLLCGSESYSQLVVPRYRSWKVNENLVGPLAGGNFVSFSGKDVTGGGMNYNKFKKK